MFELRPGMVWPDGSWLFSKFFANETIHLLAVVLLALASLGYVVSAFGLFFHQSWWRSAVTCSAVFSSVIFLLFWDGKFQALDDKGGIGILINLAILVVVLILKWPA
jgi:hypothetical protein